MDVEELISRAWGAVIKAEIPEALQPLALKEAIDYLRGPEAGQTSVTDKGNEEKQRPKRKRVQTKQADSTEEISEGDFSSSLLWSRASTRPSSGMFFNSRVGWCTSFRQPGYWEAPKLSRFGG
jgi:hypothetical protein